MKSFNNQDWRLVFQKAAKEMQMAFADVQVIDVVDQRYIDQSHVVSHAISNYETEHSVLGADFYLGQPLLRRMKGFGFGKTLVITKPVIRASGISDTLFNVSMRYAFVDTFNVAPVAYVESEADRIKREEDAELQRMQDEEDRLAFEKSEKERIAKEQAERDEKAAEEQRIKDAEAAAEAERLALLNKGDDDFPEEDLNK